MSTGEELTALTEIWRAALNRVAPEDVEQAARLLTQELLSANSADEFVDARRRQRKLVRQANQVAERLQGLLTNVDELRVEWTAMRRYSDAGLEELCKGVGDAFTLDPADGLRRWLREVVRALELDERDAAVRIAGLELGLEGEARATADDLAERVQGWHDGDDGVGLTLSEELASGRFGERLGVDDVHVRVRAHLLAAWLHCEVFDDADAARVQHDEAIRLQPSASRARVERAALFLRLGDAERATSDAQRAVELRPDSARGHLVLGACAERVGDLVAADSLYHAGLRRMTPYELATAHRRLSLLRPTGRMLLRIGERLLELARVESALRVLDEVLGLPIADGGRYGEADAHGRRSVALERLGRRAEAALSAIEAGKYHMWNEEFGDGVKQFTRARELDGTLPAAGWRLADALLWNSYPPGDAPPDVQDVTLAQSVWEETRTRFGYPGGEVSWAYLTRAAIEEILSSDAGGDAIWVALLYAERAIVHELIDATFADGQRWATAARFLRRAGLEDLALECADRVEALGTSSYSALTERIALLASAGRFDEVAAVAARVESAYGRTMWVNGVRAWAAYRQAHYLQALELLDEPSGDEAFPEHWRHSLTALCELGLGDRDAALAHYERLRESAPADGVEHCEVAVALASLGDLAGAREALRRASEDLRTPIADYFSAAAVVAIADDEGTEAAEHFQRAITEVDSVSALDELLHENALRRLGLREPPDFESLLAEQIAERRRQLEQAPAGADAQLAAALAWYAEEEPGGTPDRALHAVQARRLMQAERYGEAADVYEELLDSSFGPEARLGLRKALERSSEAHSAAGHVADVRDIQERLRSNSWADPADVALAVASALVAAGERPQALAELQSALDDASDPSHRRVLHEQIALVALTQSDAALADRHFAAAVDLMAPDDDAAQIARLEVRRGVAAALAGNFAGATERLNAALEAWQRAGAFDPAASLRQELSLAIGDSVAPALTLKISDAVVSLWRRVVGDARRADPAQLSS